MKSVATWLSKVDIRKGLPILFLGGLPILLTWPLIAQIGQAIPQGSENAPTVPLFNLWSLGWNVDRLTAGYAGYWDAPIFYPVQGAFAFSEPQPLTGLAAAVFWQFRPAAAYNLALLLFLALNGAAAYHLLRQRGLGAGAALIGGLLAQALPFVTQERGALQLQPLFGMIWALAGLWRLADQKDIWRSGLVFGLGTAVTFLTSENYALMWGVAAGTAVFWLAPRLRRQSWLALLAGVSLAALLILPIALPQRAILAEQGFSRSAEAIQKGSAQWGDYLRPASATWDALWLSWQVDGRQRLFPGLLLLGFGLAGFVLGWRRPSGRGWAGFLLVGMLVAFLASLGLNLSLGGWQPYQLLRDYAPGFADFRSPFRFAVFVQIFLALAAAEAFAWLLIRRRKTAVLLAGLVLLEVFPRPARLTAVPPPLPLPVGAGPAVIIPFVDGRNTVAYAPTANWMAATMAQNGPMVNGYSGYFPRLNSQLKSLLADFPTPVGLAALRQMGVQTVWVDKTAVSAEQVGRLATAVRQGDLAQFPAVAGLAQYRVIDAEFRPAGAYGGGWTLDVKGEADHLTLSARAAVEGLEMFVLVPQVAPLVWEVTITDAANVSQIVTRTPSGTLLLYHGSHRWLSVDLPPLTQSGTYTITLRRADTAVFLGETTFTQP